MKSNSPKNLSFKLFIFIIPVFLNASCAYLKVIEKSSKEKPSWIYGIEKDYLVGEGTGSDYNEAKYDALQMVKEKIVSAVAQNISFEQNIEVNETRYKRAIDFLEKYTSKTVSKTGNRSYLQGVSLSKASDYYWEKLRENKIETVKYFIKYPFTQADIDTLIKQWELQEEMLSQRLDTLKLSNNEHESVESIISEIEELQYLSDFFVDQRKTMADISIKSLESKLNAIQLVPEDDSLGYFRYSLHLGDDSMVTMQKPRVASNCADITEVIAKDHQACIYYNFDDCLVENKNYLNIEYSFEEWKLNYTHYFDVSSKKIFIENNNDVSFSSVNKGLFNKQHCIKCYFTITSKSPIPFTIDKIELIPQLCKRDCLDENNFKNYPIIIIDKINKSFNSKGNHSFEVIAYVPKALTKRWASRNGIQTKISGKIYYSSQISNEQKVHHFSDLRYFTNW